MENLISWKRLCFLLLGILVISILWLPARSVYSQKISPNGSAAWLGLNLNNDENHQTNDFPLDIHGDIIDILSAEQCSSAFPNLYYEVDRAASYWKSRHHTISKEDIDITWHTTLHPTDAALRILIHDNQVRVLESRNLYGAWGYYGRALPVLAMLQRAMDSATAGREQLPTIEAAIVLADMPAPPTPDGTHSFWSFTRNTQNTTHDRLWMLPNFDFYVQSEGAFEEVRRRGIARDAAFGSKIQKLVWRGQTWLNPSLRNGLLDATKGKEWADVKDVRFGDENFLKEDEVCGFAMTVHTEGASYSGRLAGLTNCNSLVFIHDLVWTTHFYHLLRPDGAEQNYVPVSNDWNDLEEKVQHYLYHPDEAEKIIKNNIATFRSKALTRAGISCYLRKLIQGYSTVAFAPEVYRPVKKVGQIPRRRGLSVEEFVALRKDLHVEDKDLSELFYE